MAPAATQTSHLVKPTDRLERSDPNRGGSVLPRCPRLYHGELAKPRFPFIDGASTAQRPLLRSRSSGWLANGGRHKRARACRASARSESAANTIITETNRGIGKL